MKTVIIIITVIISLSACNERKVPKSVLPPEKMEQVMWDVIRADEMVSYYRSADSSVNTNQRAVELYKTTFKIHNITEDQFRKSFKYYQANPHLLQIVLDSLQKKSVVVDDLAPSQKDY